MADSNADTPNASADDPVSGDGRPSDEPTPNASADESASAKPAGPSKPEDPTYRDGIDGQLLRRIITYLAPYKGWVGLAFMLVMVAAFLGPLRPKLIQVAIDDYIVLGDAEGLLRMVLLLLAVLVGEGVLSFVNSYLTQWIGQNAIYDVRIKVYRHILRQPLRFFDRLPLGKLITRTTSDVESLSDVMSAGLVTILGDLFRIVFIASFMFALNWQLALVTLSVMPLMVGLTFWFKKRVRIQFRETRKQVARINSFIQEHVTGMRIVQAFNREREELRRFKEVNNDNRVAQIKTIFYFALFYPAVEIIAAIALGLVLWVGGVRALDDVLTVGVLIAFIQYARQFFEPIRNLSDQYNTLQSAMAGAERIFGLLDDNQAIREQADAAPVPRFNGEIEFRNVWFTYDYPVSADDAAVNWILRDVSFKVAPGESVAVVGATGAGKSTIINLLLRFYEIQKGQILVDGRDICTMRLADLRRHIGLVLQDVFLFSGSVAHNLTLGDPAVTDVQVRAATRLIGADRFIERLPDQYEQDVRERGASLSHGQRQLLAFARAMIYNPSILVLDEATSSIDTESEQLIQDALERLVEGRTSVVIAHRLSTIQHADQILVMHRGRLHERGTHQELLGLGGLYRKLYELQYKEQELVNGER
ncbi:MAG: ABC transporter ATP-binding protein [Bacteroidota bacterium]